MGISQPRPKWNLVDFSLKIWHLVATVLTVMLRINWPNLVLEVREILVMRRESGWWRRKKITRKILFGQFSCKIRAFCKFSVHIFLRKNSCPSKVDPSLLIRVLPFPYLRTPCLETGPLKSSHGSGEALSSPSGVWGGAPTEMEFGGF